MEPNVIEALMPAFAAGFAVQRLLEIADPVVSRWDKENKGYYLGLLSLAVGFGLAMLANLRVLENLGADTGGLRYLDFFVTGLIISAGTEGFNSVLKLLSYKKQEQQTDSVAKSLNVRESIFREGLRKSNLMAADAFNLTLTTPEDVLKEALTERVRQFNDDPEITLNFDSGKFGQDLPSDGAAQQVAVEATAVAATQFGRVLNSKGMGQIRDNIKAETGYAAGIVIMRRALATGADPA